MPKIHDSRYEKWLAYQRAELARLRKEEEEEAKKLAVTEKVRVGSWAFEHPVKKFKSKY